MSRETLKGRLKQEEGWKLAPYRDKGKTGYLTIGAGWNIDANPLPDDIALYLMHNGEITPEMAERLLDISLTEAEKEARDLWPAFDTFSEARQDALTDMVFNMGEHKLKAAFKNSCADINAGRWASAAARLGKSLWRKQVGKRADRIIKQIREG